MKKNPIYVGFLREKECYLCEVVLHRENLRALTLNALVHEKEPYLCRVLA